MSITAAKEWEDKSCPVRVLKSSRATSKFGLGSEVFEGAAAEEEEDEDGGILIIVVEWKGVRSWRSQADIINSQLYTNTHFTALYSSAFVLHIIHFIRCSNTPHDVNEHVIARSCSLGVLLV